jgi:hypothetical protein
VSVYTVEQQYCCDQTYYSDDKNFLSTAGLLGILVPVDRTMVGVQCNPIVNIVGGVKGCQANPVCCSGNNLYVLRLMYLVWLLTAILVSNGLVNIGCNSISA